MDENANSPNNLLSIFRSLEALHEIPNYHVTIIIVQLYG